MSKEAMKLALQYIEANAETKDEHEIATGLRQAIAEAEKQEPVGRFAKFTDGIWREVADGSAGVPLYTTPQQRTWVGLTYEDMVSLQKDLHDSNGEIVLPTTFAKAVEAKLKEKNNG